MTVNGEGSKNAHSMVLGMRHGNFGMVFTGDAEGETERAAAEHFPGKFAERVVISGSHHGAETHDSNSSEWAAAMKPDATIFNAGGRFFHPRCSSMQVFQDGLAPANPHPIRCGSSTAYTASASAKAEYVTQTNGTIVVTGRPDGSFSIDCSLSANCGPLPIIGILDTLPAQRRPEG